MRDIRLPSDLSLVNEMMSWLEFSTLAAQMPCLLSMSRGKGAGVFVLPGFGGGDGSTAPLRHYLSLLGYDVSGWSKGTNNGQVLDLLDQMRDAVKEESELTGDKITLIGWSLGGYIAREVAREIPNV